MPPAPVAHAVAKCCWCAGPLYLLGAHYWCQTRACADRQRKYAMGVTRADGWHWLYVPTPKQVEFESGRTKYGLYGGAAGGAKSFGGRWALYRYCLTVPKFEALLLRETFKQLEKTHLRRMAREAVQFAALGIPCEFRKSDRMIVFPSTGSFVEAGHMDDDEAVENYLSTEYDGIMVDEGSRLPPRPLLELSTRTSRTRRKALDDAGGSFFWVMTNPGGPATQTLIDFFIDHTPNFEDFPALKTKYRPEDWRYTEAKIEDNPYLDPDYENTLALLGPVRYEQLRHANWRLFHGQFFGMWRESAHVVDLPTEGLEFFRSLDWGRSAPGCVLWWACLPDGELHIAAELKFVDQDVREVVAAVKAQDHALGIARVRYTAADPALFLRTQETGESISETFARAQMPLRRVSNDRHNGWTRVRELLGPSPSGRPWLTVSPACRYLIRTLPQQLQDPHDPEDVNTNGDDHAVDTLRYGAMSRPAPTRFVAPEPPPGSVGEAIAAIRQDAVLESGR